MKAYALIAPFQENFSTMNLIGQIKGTRIIDFKNLPWVVNHNLGQTELPLESGQALYLYGGRQALVAALNPVKTRCVIGPKEKRFALFRAQRSTNGVIPKVKQLLMLTPYPKEVSPILQTRWENHNILNTIEYGDYAVPVLWKVEIEKFMQIINNLVLL